MRTITQRTTLPFFIAESGAASLTEAVITSPKPARRPRSPPRGRMQESFRAPELSATSRIVRIPIIDIQPPIHRGGAETRRKPCSNPPWLRVSAVNEQSRLHVQVCRLRAYLRGSTDYFGQPP